MLVNNKIHTAMKISAIPLKQTDACLTAFCQDNLSKLAPERLSHCGSNEARDNGEAVASAGPYANHLHFAPYT